MDNSHLECGRYRLHMIKCLEKIKGLVSSCLKSAMIDGEFLAEMVGLANCASRAKEAEVESYIKMLMEGEVDLQ